MATHAAGDVAAASDAAEPLDTDMENAENIVRECEVATPEHGSTSDGNISNKQGKPSAIPGGDLPPSYEEVTGQARSRPGVVDVASHECDLYYMDFIPKINPPPEPGCVHSINTYADTFDVLIKKANEWLESTTQTSIINCETVTQPWSNSLGYHPHRSVGTVSMTTADVSIAMHVLRIWYRVDPQQLSAGQICHQDFRTPYGKDIDDQLDMINSITYRQPGRILNLETVLHNRLAGQRTELTCWLESGLHDRSYIHFLRVYSLKRRTGEGQIRGIIDYVDFVPAAASGKTLGSGPHEAYEPFPHVMHSFDYWLKHKVDRHTRILSIKTIPTKVKRGNSSFWQRTEFTEKIGIFYNTTYLCILRVFFEKAGKISPPPQISRHIVCRSWMPRQLTCPRNDGILNFEKFPDFILRISHWVKRMGARILYVETQKIPMYPDLKQNCENVFSDTRPTTRTSWQVQTEKYADHNHWLFIVRLYLERSVVESSEDDPESHVPFYKCLPPSEIKLLPEMFHLPKDSINHILTSFFALPGGNKVHR